MEKEVPPLIEKGAIGVAIDTVSGAVPVPVFEIETGTVLAAGSGLHPSRMSVGVTVIFGVPQIPFRHVPLFPQEFPFCVVSARH
jgi:hypothetical protein